jgi:hypothetical protein
MMKITKTIDVGGREIRERRCGWLRCRCGMHVKLWQSTDVWTRCDRRYLPMKWRHSEYGDPHGFCECGLAYHGMPDGAMAVIDCRKQAPD